jgi:hypothetical protein
MQLSDELQGHGSRAGGPGIQGAFKWACIPVEIKSRDAAPMRATTGGRGRSSMQCMPSRSYPAGILLCGYERQRQTN